MDLKEETALGPALATHWYYRAKAQAMADSLEGGSFAHVLDVGAGSGYFSRWLLVQGRARRATCVDPGYAADRDDAVAGRPIAFRRAVAATDADLVLMMDVLEHVDDDAGLLAQYLDLVAPGVPVLITVPAFQFLWSGHDRFLEHRRRYTAASVGRLVARAGARPLALHYYFGAVLPVAALVRLARRGATPDRSDMGPVPGPLNALLTGICAVERRVMRWNRLGGLSVVCRAARG